MWVCETNIVHYLERTGLFCAPTTSIEPHQPALFIMVALFNFFDLVNHDIYLLIIDSDRDGAQYDVVSPALFVLTGMTDCKTLSMQKSFFISIMQSGILLG